MYSKTRFTSKHYHKVIICSIALFKCYFLIYLLHLCHVFILWCQHTGLHTPDLLLQVLLLSVEASMVLLASFHCLLPADQLIIFFNCSLLFFPQEVNENAETLFIQVELSQLQLKLFFLHLVQQGLIFLSLELQKTRDLSSLFCLLTLDHTTVQGIENSRADNKIILITQRNKYHNNYKASALWNL